MITLTLPPPVDSEAADAGSSGMATSSKAGDMSQDSPDQPSPLRYVTQTTQN